MEAKTKKHLKIGAAGLITVLLLYGLYKMLTKDKEEETSANNSTSASNSTFKNKGFPLRYGSSGKDVMTLQKILNRHIRPPRVLLVVDGKFGKKTEAAALHILKSKSVSRSVFDREKREYFDLIF